MKKISVFAIAIASMAMAMTSCNKEEKVASHEIMVSIEENEASKLRLEDEATVSNAIWENNDIIVVYDHNCNGNEYLAQVNGDECHFYFNRKVTTEDMDESDNLFAYYPHNMGTTYYGQHWMRIPRVQTSQSGEFKDFPMYGEGTIDNFIFRNVCGIMRFKLTGSMTIDSIAITTEQPMTGSFAPAWTTGNILTPRAYKNFGTNTAVLKMEQGAALTGSEKVVNMYVMPGVYNVFDITFYAGNQSYTMRNTDPITVERAHISTITKDLTAANFKNEVYGTTNALFSLGTGNAYIAKGNLQFIGGHSTYDMGSHVWALHSNGFDCMENGEFMTSNHGMACEIPGMDIFTFGANQYFNIFGYLAGNTVFMYRTSNWDCYSYLNQNVELSGLNDQACNAKVNADNTLTWKTPSAAEWNALLANNGSKMVTLDFLTNSVKGLLIAPNASSIDINTVSNNIDKAEWNNLVKAGCAFLPMTYYRTYVAGAHWTELGVYGKSMYMTTTSIDADNANVMWLDENGMTAGNAHKAFGGFIRPIAMAN